MPKNIVSDLLPNRKKERKPFKKAHNEIHKLLCYSLTLSNCTATSSTCGSRIVVKFTDFLDLNNIRNTTVQASTM